MVLINAELTRRVADLARLELSPEEVSVFTSQMGEVLKYIDQLQEISVEGVEPLTHPVDLSILMREDEVKEFSDLPRKPSSKILQSAPDVLYDGYKVPPIL